MSERDPSSHRTPEQIRKMDRGYNHTPRNIKRRDERNQARRLMTHELGASAVAGKDVNHIVMVKNGGTNARSNLNIESQHKNRGWERDE